MSWRYLTHNDWEPVSYSDVKEQLRIDSDDEAGYINTLISAARAYGETDTRRTFIRRQIELVTEEHDVGRWECHRDLVLPRGPVVSVDSVQTLDGTTVSPSLYRLEHRADVAYLRGEGLPWGLKVTYTAGYGPDPLNVPADLRVAVMLHVAHLWENRSASTTRPQTHIAMGLDCIYGQYRIGGVIG